MKRIKSSTGLLIGLAVLTYATAVTSSVFGQEKPNRSWADRLEYVGIAVEEPGYHVWGSSPVIGPAGKTHLFVARWRIEEQFKAWLTHCEIARYVSDHPKGPFVFQEVVVEGSGEKGDWDFQSPHNPTVQRIGHRYVLSYIANAGGTKQECVASQRIGMMIAPSPEGPWEKVGNDAMVLAPPKDAAVWSFQSSVGVNNPALLQHPDGRFFLYYKAMKKGDVRRMGVAIADDVEGPYAFSPTPHLPLRRLRNQPQRRKGNPLLFVPNQTTGVIRPKPKAGLKYPPSLVAYCF